MDYDAPDAPKDEMAGATRLDAFFLGMDDNY
jgi:hypothetical protein